MSDMDSGRDLVVGRQKRVQVLYPGKNTSTCRETMYSMNQVAMTVEIGS